MNKKVSFYTLGCRLNQAETAVLNRSFDREGYEVVDFREPADIVVVNTCTVTENGDADARKVVNKINRINPESKIALVGCQAQVQKEKLLDWPGVHWVIGNAQKMDFAILLKEIGFDQPRVITPTIPRESFTIPIAGIDEKHTRANLKIQDGCDFFCSFCEIPYARGRARSREFDDIIREATELVNAGHKELVVTGINVGTYNFKNKNVVDVLSALEDVKGLERIRISSIEPTTIPENILGKMAQKNKLCRYLHIPLQSGSDEILEKMERKYTVKEFSQFILNAHTQIENVCIGTDVIVGFPGETDSLFQETDELLRELPFTYFHVFSYSDRNQAKSRKLENKIDDKTIAKRSKRLRELSARKRRTYFENMIGKTETVLFEQMKNELWTGVTDTYIRVKVKSDKNLQNEILPVQLCEIDGQTMIGKLV
jgi:threonylcarbamoyladenosine tRNA methylthiotransferase MtaB